MIDRNTLDRNDLVSLGKRWTPDALVSGPDSDRAAKAMSVIVELLAHALNPYIDLALYTPVLMDPFVCLDGDLHRVLSQAGVRTTSSPDADTARAMAVTINPAARHRASNRAINGLAAAVTGHRTYSRPWVKDVVALDESTFEWIMALESDEDAIVLYYQGSAQTSRMLAEVVDRAATGYADRVLPVPCWGLNVWKDGIEGWDFSGTITEHTSSFGVIDYIVIESSASDQIVRPTTSPVSRPGDDDACVHSVTAWFQVSDDPSDYFEIRLFVDDTTSDWYALRLRPGIGSQIQLMRYNGGTATEIVSSNIDIDDGNGAWQRVDFMVDARAAKDVFMVRVNGNDPFGYRSLASNRPRGYKGDVMLDRSECPDIEVRLAGLLFMETR